jgi:flagellar basal body-associated protein FliL
MMRDYKFRQTEWPRRRSRGKMLRVLAVAVVVIALALLGVVAWQVLSGPTGSERQPTAATSAPSDPRVIPLQIPPHDNPPAPTNPPSAGASPD